MIKKIDVNSYGVVKYIISTEDEVEKLPCTVSQGSSCTVISTSNVYIFNEHDLSWHLLKG